MNPVSRDFPTHELVEVLFLKQYGFGISFYYIVMKYQDFSFY